MLYYIKTIYFCHSPPFAADTPASLLVRKHGDASVLSGNGYNAYEELVTTYKRVINETIRAKTEALAAIKTIVTRSGSVVYRIEWGGCSRSFGG